GSGSAVFSAPVISNQPTNLDLPLYYPVIAADLTGDGRDDLGVMALSSGEYFLEGTVLACLPDGSFGPPTELQNGLAAEPEAMRFGDTDADGDLDVLLLCNSDKTALKIFSNDGSGGFTPQPAATDVGGYP